MLKLSQTETENHNNSNSTPFSANLAAGITAGTAAGNIAPLAYTQAAGFKPFAKHRGEQTTPVIKRQTQEMSDLLRTRGFKQTGTRNNGLGYDMPVFSSPKYKQNIIFEPNDVSIARGGPNMAPEMEFQMGPDGFPSGVKFNYNNRMIHVGRGNSYGSTGTLAHELGHGLQGERALRANEYGIRIMGLGTVGAGIAGALRSDDPNKQKTYDRIGSTVAGVGTLGGLTTAATEFDASLKGYKMMRDAGKFKGLKGLNRISKRFSPFNGVPTYLMGAAAPAATYYGARYLPEKIQGLYHSLKNKSKGE